MTQFYAESMARDALQRLNGLEKMIPANERIIITVTSDGQNIVQVVSPTHTGAVQICDFVQEGTGVRFAGCATHAFGAA